MTLTLFVLTAMLSAASNQSLDPSALLAQAIANPAAFTDDAYQFMVSSQELPPEKSTLYKAMGIALVGTAASDVISTEYVIRGGGYEMNPVGRTNVYGRTALKSAGTAVVWWWTDRVHRDGHTKAALWMRIAAVSVWGYATMHNIRIGQNLRGGQ